MAQQLSIPIQPVENPILCSPYKEPDQHWLYDTKTGCTNEDTGSTPCELLVQERTLGKRTATDVVSGRRRTRRSSIGQRVAG